jgi:hypothetical protein
MTIPSAGAVQVLSDRPNPSMLIPKVLPSPIEIFLGKT